MSLLMKMLQEWTQALGRAVPVNTGCKTCARPFEAVLQELPFAAEVQVERRVSDVGLANDVADSHRRITV